MADKTTADIGFEKQIWDAACVLRGNLDASEYLRVQAFFAWVTERTRLVTKCICQCTMEEGFLT